MRKMFGPVLVAAIVLIGVAPAWASSIAISGDTTDPRYLAGTTTNSNLGDLSAICAAFYPGVSPCPLEGGQLLYYKAETGGGDLGGLANFYSYADSGGTGDSTNSGGTISYTGDAGDPIASCPYCYLIVKDGNQGNPAQFLFTLNSIGDGLGSNAAWDGSSDIVLSSFWTGKGAISNVAIWGTPAGVPDGGLTLLLLGGALLGLGTARRRLR